MKFVNTFCLYLNKKITFCQEICWKGHKVADKLSDPGLTLGPLSFVLTFILSTSGAKQTKVFGTEEPGNTENTKEEDSENSKGKLKDISNTDKETKQTNVLGKKEPLKTDNTENFSDKTKLNGSENSEEKLKDISNTDKYTYG